MDIFRHGYEISEQHKTLSRTMRTFRSKGLRRVSGAARGLNRNDTLCVIIILLGCRFAFSPKVHRLDEKINNRDAWGSESLRFLSGLKWGLCCIMMIFV